MARTGAAGGWLLMLLGLSFLGAGGYVGYLTVTTLTDWHAAKKWVEAPATIQRLELAQHRGKKGHVSYRVLCEYAYPFGGQTLGPV